MGVATARLNLRRELTNEKRVFGDLANERGVLRDLTNERRVLRREY